MDEHGTCTIDIHNGTDIDRLHAVVNMKNPGRGAGRTYAECHTVAGVLETTSEGGVVCLVNNYDRVTDIMRQLIFKVFMDHDISFHKTINRNRFMVYLPDKREKQIQFLVLEHADELHGNTWPVVTFTEYDRRKATRYETGDPGK